MHWENCQKPETFTKRSGSAKLSKVKFFKVKNFTWNRVSNFAKSQEAKNSSDHHPTLKNVLRKKNGFYVKSNLVILEPQIMPFYNYQLSRSLGVLLNYLGTFLKSSHRYVSWFHEIFSFFSLTLKENDAIHFVLTCFMSILLAWYRDRMWVNFPLL